MLSKFKSFLGQPKSPLSPEVAKPTSSESATPEQHPQHASQWEQLEHLYKTFESNPWNETIEQSLRKLLDSLQKYTISDYLVASFKKDVLEKYKESALKEFEAMGTINRERVQSLVDLSDEEMHKTIYECLFLCNINPSEAPPLELSDSHGFDAKGNPILEKNVYPVFAENALTGVAGIDRFLPAAMINGDSEKNIQGMNNFLQNEYSELAAQSGTNTAPIIKAITTIGSLGGIGHKPDSDMDLQVIFNTNPEYEHRWNDADFFIAIWTYILQNLQHNFLEKTLPEEKRKALKEKVVAILKAQSEHLNEEEKKIITKIFPSSYQRVLEKEVWKAFNGLKMPQQSILVQRQFAQDLVKFPYMEAFFADLKKFFPSLKSVNSLKLYTNCFPYSAKALTQDKLGNWFIKFYKDQHLGKRGVQQILQRYAKQKGVAVASINRNAQMMLIQKNFSQLKQRFPIIESFLNFIANSISLEYKKRMPEIIALTLKQFDPQNEYLKEKLEEELQWNLSQSFRAQMIQLIDFYLDLEASKIEAKSESALHRKIQMIEAYLTKKYPNTEVHLFTNILRNQRRGQHTPFLVSPEGSMAYSLMLNDFLLNPAVVLAGISPMPFDISPDLKVLLSIGVFPATEWSLSQKKGESVESFNITQLADWGSLNIPREKLWSHAIPIYLRESEKVSHRNLPKALLNCWWLEMLCCMEKDPNPTSLTQLLWNPDLRYFIKHKVESPIVSKIQEIEKGYPVLIRDPWWLKFSEMLVRFDDAKMQNHIIFCFAQHIRLTDIIDFNNDCKPIWLDKSDKNINWRIKALVAFYDLFFPNQNERVDLMKFAQGRDDIGNKTEKKLKQAFLDSMNRTEQKLIEIGNEKAASSIIKYLRKADGGATTEELEETVHKFLKKVNQHIIIADETIFAKSKSEEPLNAMEESQLEILQKDRQQLRQKVEELVADYAKRQIQLSVPTLEKYILDARIKLAGDPLENVIFKYHFERNFKRKPFQVPLPISKSLSIPRKKIMLEFNVKRDNWLFKSILSKQDSRGSGGGSEMGMFSASLVEGLARCVFSGYVGFTNKNLTAFEKPASHHRSPVARNPLTHQDIQDLAFAINEFFRPQRVRPQELLENLHYITDIFMMGNVNRYSVVSLVVRDNFGEHFVVDYDLAKIKIKIVSNQGLTQDDKFPKFFLRLHSKEGRRLFQQALDQLKIPLDPNHKPKFRVWINFGDFELTTSPKFYRVYVNGIAENLWPAETIATPHMLNSRKLEKSLDEIGKMAIQRYREIEAEKKALAEKVDHKMAHRARAHMDRKRKIFE